MRALIASFLLFACADTMPIDPLPFHDCDPEDLCCAPIALTEAECGEAPAIADGWDDPPGSGAAFVVNAIAIAGKDRGFNVDSICHEETGCIDNSLWRLGELGNDQLRQALLGGERLMVVEIAGLEPHYRGWDRSITVKMYNVVDADEPPFPANNFKVPPGHSTCCEFEILATSLDGSAPRTRFAARIRDGKIETLTKSSIAIPSFIFPDDEEVDVALVERAAVSATMPTALTELNEGLLGGAWLSRSLDSIDNPYCKTVSPRCPVQFTDSSMLDLITSLSLRPDIDVDQDGLECAVDQNGDGQVDRCCACNNCNAEVIPPADAADPASCTRNLADGHSLALTWTAVRASIVGVGM